MNSIEQILNSNLTQEQKEALLGQYANDLINNKEKTFEEKRQELIEKNKKQAEIVREKNKAYEEKSYKEEEQKKREKELEDKLEFIIKEEEKKGKPIEKEDLKELTGYEIEAIYNNITEGREEIAKKENDSSKEKINPKENKEIDYNNSKEQEKSNGNDNVENDDNDEKEKQEETTKRDIKVGPKLANNRFPYYGATQNSSGDKEDKEKESQNNDSPKVDTTPEPKKKVTAITKAKDWLKSKVNEKTAKALLAIAGGIAALALFVVSAPLAVTALGAGYIYNTYQKGAKEK